MDKATGQQFGLTINNFMNTLLIITLFIVGCLFSNASHVPQWFLGAGKPTHQHWKIYGLIALIIWILLIVGTIL